MGFGVGVSQAVDEHHAAHHAPLVPARTELHVTLRHLVRVRVRVRVRVAGGIEVGVGVGVGVGVRVRRRPPPPPRCGRRRLTPPITTYYLLLTTHYLLLTTYYLLLTTYRLGVVGVVHVLIDEGLQRIWSGSVVRVRLGVWVSGQGQWSGSVVRVVVWVRVSGQRSG